MSVTLLLLILVVLVAILAVLLVLGYRELIRPRRVKADPTAVSTSWRAPWRSTSRQPPRNNRAAAVHDAGFGLTGLARVHYKIEMPLSTYNNGGDSYTSSAEYVHEYAMYVAATDRGRIVLEHQKEMLRLDVGARRSPGLERAPLVIQGDPFIGSAEPPLAIAPPSRRAGYWSRHGSTAA